MTRLHLIILSYFSFFIGTFSALAQFDPEITTRELEQHIGYLASDNLEGRYPGSRGGSLAAQYIHEKFKEAGLELDDYSYQYFMAETSIAYGKNSLVTGDREWEQEAHYVPFSFSSNNTVTAGVAFCGYGFDLEQENYSWKDYEGVDVNGKWALILRGLPAVENKHGALTGFKEDRDKALAARDNGAAGVLLVSGYEYDTAGSLVQLFFDKSKSDVGIPVFHIKREVAEYILGGAGKQLSALEESIASAPGPASFELDVTISGTAAVQPVNSRLMNVVGRLNGCDDTLNQEYIVVGAHFDHLGFGGPGSGSRTFELNKVHNGADDNASGVAGLIELAGKLASSSDSLKRSIVFVAFDGEEMGLLGSKHFLDATTIDKSRISVMINFDMIGRLKEDSLLFIGGTGTSEEAEGILKGINKGRFNLSLAAEGYGPSDHASFYAEDIPVFFISTGAHSDYHTPDDDLEFINLDGEKRVTEFANELVMELANLDRPLTFREAGPKERERSGYDFKVTLGIMPDFTSGDNNGLRVDGVREGGPAYRGGMLKGDVIVAMEGREVKNIYDYMARLKKFTAGQTITVDVMRDGKMEVLIVQL